MRKIQDNDDLNFIAFVREIWAAKFFLIVGLCVGVLMAFTVILFAEPQVEARMMIGPAQPMEVDARSRSQDAQSSYVYAAKSADEGQGFSNFTRFEAMMGGVSVARLLLRDQRIVEGLRSDRRFVFDDVQSDMRPEELAGYIRKRVRLDPFGETALREVYYRHHDGVFASYFVQQIHRISDQLIRANLRGQVDERIGYLERLIGKTANPEQRRIMTDLLLEQERLRMMVSMDSPVAASVIEPASAQARTVWPDAYLFYGGFGVAGLLIGYLVFGLVYFGREDVIAEGVSVGAGRGEDLRHKPKRPLKYGSWFQNTPDNANDLPAENLNARRLKGASDAAE